MCVTGTGSKHSVRTGGTGRDRSRTRENLKFGWCPKPSHFLKVSQNKRTVYPEQRMSQDSVSGRRARARGTVRDKLRIIGGKLVVGIMSQTVSRWHRLTRVRHRNRFKTLRPDGRNGARQIENERKSENRMVSQTVSFSQSVSNQKDRLPWAGLSPPRGSTSPINCRQA